MNSSHFVVRTTEVLPSLVEAMLCLNGISVMSLSHLSHWQFSCYSLVQNHFNLSLSQTATASFVAPILELFTKVLAAAFTLPAQSLPESVAPSL